VEEDTLPNRIKAAYTAGAEPPPPTTQSRHPAPASFASSPPPGAGIPCSPAPLASSASSVSIASEDYEADWEPPVGPMTALDRLLLAGLLAFDMAVLAFVVVMLAVLAVIVF
jgi:hypothetical protein